VGDLPPHLRPFVLPTPRVERERGDTVDFYLPAGGGRVPAIVFVHGGPVPADLRPTMRETPVYVGYGSQAAARGVVGVTADLRLHDLTDYPRAAGDAAAAVDAARRHRRVDPDRIAVWAFSGGGLLLADWLREPPGWLRCLGATYPLLAPWDGAPIEDRFRPADALAGAGSVPIVLTRVGRERPWLAGAVAEFLAAARVCGVPVEVVDVPNGQHAFDMLDHTDESRRAVHAAFDAVLAHLTAEAAR